MFIERELASIMRTTLFVSSMLFLAIACRNDRDNLSRSSASDRTTAVNTGGGPASDDSPGTGTVSSEQSASATHPGQYTAGGSAPHDTTNTDTAASNTGAAGADTSGQAASNTAAGAGTSGQAASSSKTQAASNTGTGTGGQSASSTGSQPSGSMAGGAGTSDRTDTATTNRGSTGTSGSTGTANTTASGSRDMAANARGSRAGTNGIAVQADCNGTMPSSAQLAQQNPNGRAIQDVGRAAMLVENGQSQQLVAVDDDSDCRITVEAPSGIDAIALGRAILDTLPPRG